MTSSSRKCVLIVDDAPTIQAQIRGGLEREFDCLVASNGQAALQLATERTPDVIVSDVEMPGMSGSELLRALKALDATKHIPVIMCTTTTGLAEVNACRALGCAGYVLKPVNIEYLTAKIRQLSFVPAAG